MSINVKILVRGRTREKGEERRRRIKGKKGKKGEREELKEREGGL